MSIIHVLSLATNGRLVIDSYDEEYLRKLERGLDGDEGYESGPETLAAEMKDRLNLDTVPSSFDRKQCDALLEMLTQLHRAGLVLDEPFMIDANLFSVKGHPVIVNFDTIRQGNGGEMIEERFRLLEALLPWIPKEDSPEKIVILGPTTKSFDDLALRLETVQEHYSIYTDERYYYLPEIELQMFPDIDKEYLDGSIEYPIILPTSQAVAENTSATELYDKLAESLGQRWEKYCNLPPYKAVRRIAAHGDTKCWLVVSFWTRRADRKSVV